MSAFPPPTTDTESSQSQSCGVGVGVGSAASAATSSPPLSKHQIAIFGSSVNPPTGDWGHRGIVSKLVMINKFDELLINPVYKHIYAAKKGLLSFEHRYQMCVLNFLDTAAGSDSASASSAPRGGGGGGGMIRTKVTVSDVERTCVEGRIYEGESCGTIDILNYLRAQHPDKEFHLVLGFDGFSDLINKKWKQWDKIIATTQLHVFRRGEEINPNLPTYGGINVTFYEIDTVSAMNIADQPAISQSNDAVTSVYRVQSLVVSSTLIREKVKYVYEHRLQDAVLRRLANRFDTSPELVGHDLGVLFDSNHLNPEVAKYIIENNLFAPEA